MKNDVLHIIRYRYYTYLIKEIIYSSNSQGNMKRAITLAKINLLTFLFCSVVVLLTFLCCGVVVVLTFLCCCVVIVL